MSLPLHSTKNPEEKRRIIGDTFMKVADSLVVDLQLQVDNVYLAQGEVCLFNDVCTQQPEIFARNFNCTSFRMSVTRKH